MHRELIKQHCPGAAPAWDRENPDLQPSPSRAGQGMVGKRQQGQGWDLPLLKVVSKRHRETSVGEFHLVARKKSQKWFGLGGILKPWVCSGQKNAENNGNKLLTGGFAVFKGDTDAGATMNWLCDVSKHFCLQ